MSHETPKMTDLADIDAPSVVMMVGVPGSGKSRIAEQLSTLLSIPILSSDAIREEICGDASNQSINDAMWQLLYQRAESALASQQSVIIDATHAVAEYRRKDIDRYRTLGAQAVVGVYIVTSFHMACERNALRERTIPQHAIRRMHGFLQATPPSTAEGFDMVIPVCNN